jgi:hypothetical protein
MFYESVVKREVTLVLVVSFSGFKCNEDEVNVTALTLTGLSAIKTLQSVQSV